MAAAREELPPERALCGRRAELRLPLPLLPLPLPLLPEEQRRRHRPLLLPSLPP